MIDNCRSEWIIQAKDFEFQPFHHEGFGGQKYIAMPKEHNSSGTLFIKQDGIYSPACNEFVYGRMLEVLGVPSLLCYMMNTDTKRSMFRQKYVVGIEFRDDWQKRVDKELLTNPLYQKQLIEAFAAEVLFTDFEDNLQVAFVPEKGVVSFDHQESFLLKNGDFRVLCADDSVAVPCGNGLLNRWFETSPKFSFYVDVAKKMVAEATGLPIDDVHKIVCETFDRFSLLDDKLCGLLPT